MTVWQRAAWAAGAAAVAALLASLPPYILLERLWQDGALRLSAPRQASDAALVVDIDDASLRALQPQHGPWPLPRALHATVAQRLLDAGARAVVFNLSFEDARDGDSALQVLADRSARIVVGARALPLAASAPTALPAAAWRDLAGVPALVQADVAWPTPALLGSAARIGTLANPVDDDGLLRCTTVLQRSGGLLLPSLPVAALLVGAPPPQPRRDGTTLVLGHWRWPVDERGCVVLRLPARADAVPALRYATVALAEGGLPPELAARVHGRTVFVGSPMLLDLPVMTPLGQIGATQWQALAFDALSRGAVLQPAPPAARAALLALALAPAGWGAWRRRPDLRQDTWLTLLATALVVAAALGALLAAGLWLPLPLALLLLLCGLAAAALRAHQWLAAQRRRAEHERAAAESANAAKTQFLAQVSHEIRTPLNAVLGMADLLAETPLTSTQRRFVDVFGAAGRHLQALIEDLLDLSRIEVGELQLQSEPFDPVALAREVAALFESRALAQGLRFVVELDPALPPRVRGDRRRVRQMLVNLLGNALKFTERGQVALALRRLDEAQLEFEVRDSGIGVPAPRLQAIFEPFTQADDSVARRYGGTGLGLAITRRLADAMGGQVAMDSTVGVGSVVRLRLPLPPTDDKLPAAPVVPPGPRWDGRRILLAEDNPNNVLVVEGFLQSSGVQIDAVDNGRAAVERARRGSYDLILMDVQMPQLDGHAATREIRRHERAEARPPVPIIALSANALPTDRQASLEAGCNLHLAKPLQRTALLAALAAHLAPSARPAAPPSPAGGDDDAPDDGADGIDRLVQRHFGGDQALYQRVRLQALQQWRLWPQRFDAADSEERRRLAHDLKAVAATVGARALATAAATLEQCCRDGVDSAAALEAVHVQLASALRRHADAID